MRGPMLIVVVLLAGCTSEPDLPDVDAPIPVADVIEAPTWNVGDWWTFALGPDLVTWVVSEANGDHYVLDVDDPDWAFQHAAFAQISTIGPIGKANLEGTQEHGAVALFQFPLELGKTWAATWDNATWDVTVAGVADGVAVMEATTGDLTRTYTYDNQTKWLGRMQETDGNGTVTFAAEIHRSGSGYTGTYYRWEVHGDHAYTSGFGDVSMRSFSVPADATDVWGWYRISCDPGGLEGENGFGILEAHPQDDSNAGISEHVTCPVTIEETVVLDPHPGEWGVTLQSSGARIEWRFIPRTLLELTV